MAFVLVILLHIQVMKNNYKQDDESSLPTTDWFMPAFTIPFIRKLNQSESNFVAIEADLVEQESDLVRRLNVTFSFG